MNSKTHHFVHVPPLSPHVPQFGNHWPIIMLLGRETRQQRGKKNKQKNSNMPKDRDFQSTKPMSEKKDNTRNGQQRRQDSV